MLVTLSGISTQIFSRTFLRIPLSKPFFPLGLSYFSWYMVSSYQVPEEEPLV